MSAPWTKKLATVTVYDPEGGEAVINASDLAGYLAKGFTETPPEAPGGDSSGDGDDQP